MVRLTVRLISVTPTENKFSVSLTENTISVRPTENQFSVSLTENQFSVSLTENMFSVRPTENFDTVILTVWYPDYNSNFINFLFWFFFVQCQKTLTSSWRVTHQGASSSQTQAKQLQSASRPLLHKHP